MSDVVWIITGNFRMLTLEEIKNNNRYAPQTTSSTDIFTALLQLVSSTIGQRKNLVLGIFRQFHLSLRNTVVVTQFKLQNYFLFHSILKTSSRPNVKNICAPCSVQKTKTRLFFLKSNIFGDKRFDESNKDVLIVILRDDGGSGSSSKNTERL